MGGLIAVGVKAREEVRVIPRSLAGGTADGVVLEMVVYRKWVNARFYDNDSNFSSIY